MNLSIPILLGTAREGRQSEAVAHFVHAQAKAFGFTTRLIDVRDFVDNGITNGAMSAEKSAEWQRIMQEADGLIVVAPEYNHGYPGELKIMLDELEDEYRYKPLAICGVSSGGMGGVRMVEALHQVAITLYMVNVRNAVYFANAEQPIDETTSSKRLRTMYEELSWWATALKTARKSA